ncbi:MAG: GGDEF domain-containing protein, partial [Gammaproteobacteria bacterium]
MSTSLQDKKLGTTVDWKDKYFQNINDFDRKEKIWAKDEEKLLKTILLLVFTYRGVEKELDGKLRNLQTKLPICNSITEKKQIIENIVNSIVSHTRKQKPAVNGQTPADNFVKLLERINLPTPQQEDLNRIRNRLLDKSQNIDSAIEQIAETLNRANTGPEKQDRNQINTSNDTFQAFLDRLSQTEKLGTTFDSIKIRAAKVQDQNGRLKLVDDCIQQLLGSLAVEHTSALPTDKANLDWLNEHLLILLDWIVLPENKADQIKKLRHELSHAKDKTYLTKLLQNIATLINTAHADLQKEFNEIEHFLKKVIKQLTKLAMQITQAEQSQTESYECSQALNDKVINHMQAIQANVSEAQEIEDIKQTINYRLDAIQSNMGSFIAIEHDRHIQSDSRVRDLKHRINEMETEAEQLLSNIEVERAISHRDPLTNIPNRLAYDERIAEEYARWQRHGHDLTLCLIDIDHFKNVNDAYGHMAGDKVLVA